jgi:alcohol dehydrogenase (cytochrome c)
VDGVIYFSTPDNVFAVDARSGHQVWHYTYPANKGFHIGSRGVSMYGEWLYFMTPDSHLICLNAKDGSVRWNVPVADAGRGYWTTMSPLIIRNHVFMPYRSWAHGGLSRRKSPVLPGCITLMQ